MIYRDPIVEEIHKHREEYAKSFNYDLDAIFEDMKKKQVASRREFVKLPIKRVSDLASHSTTS